MSLLAALAASTLATTVPHTPLGCPAHPRTAAGALATEHAWVRAIESRNSKLLACILAPEFADTSWRGELVERATVLTALPSHAPVRLQLSGLSVFLDGRFAIVRGTNTQQANGRTVGTVRFTDMFVYRGGAWRAVSAQETPLLKE